VNRSQSGNSASGNVVGGDQKENDLVLQLKVQLAEAINLQDCDLVAQLHETIRCLRQFDNQEYVKICISTDLSLKFLVHC
jgi:hypothetical protein